jgi:predicted transposase YbfD/YdcC
MIDNKVSLVEHFKELADPRDGRYIWHELSDILLIAVCAAICGADNWVAVEAFGQAKVGWLKESLGLSLPHGIPSHDTFGTVFSLIEPEAFQACFIGWAQAVREVSEGEIVAIDGKTLRRSPDQPNGRAAIAMVSAWANDNHLVLGQRQVAEASNEITAIPALLELLMLKGCIVTIDAIGCQTEIARQIVAQEADYVLALKDNQGKLYQEVVDLFKAGLKTDFQRSPAHFVQTFSYDHGRQERRRCWAIDAPDFIAYLDPQHNWPGLQSVVMVEARRIIGDQVSLETRYFIASLPGDPDRLLAAVRSHWSIENKLHWVLDLAFDEDHARVRQGHAPANFAVIRHIALNLLKQETSDIRGIKTKRLHAALDPAYLEKILSF